MRAVEVLREANRKRSAVLPKSAPIGFVRQRWASLVLPGGVTDRRHYELCVLSELRGRLQAGDVWVKGSRRYRSFDERLISEGKRRLVATFRAWLAALRVVLSLDGCGDERGVVRGP